MSKVLINSLLILFLLPASVHGINKWPKEIPLKDGGKIIIYQPQAESLTNNVLRTRAAIAIRKNSKAEPIFGVIWSEAVLEADRMTRMATLSSIKITDARFPDEIAQSKIDSLKNFLSKEILKWNLEVSLDEITTSIEMEKGAADDKLNTAPPKITYSDVNATLLLFDGKPIVKKDDKLNIERALNTPFLLVKSPEDKKYYLYGQKAWYSSSSLTEGWETVKKKFPATIENLRKQVLEIEKKNNDTSKVPSPIPVIIVSTEPTELIQSNGPAKFASVENTGLLYMSNSDDDVFMEVGGQQYYVVLSGRWYKATALKGPWAYVASDALPADFAKIPEESKKGTVLSSIAGTEAAKEAMMDAQIPQTAKVDRKKATPPKITYDGDPKFESISGTSLELAMNTTSTVMRSGGKYYCVENAVWFVSAGPTGPWVVSDQRPADVDSIPPTSKAYNTKYVYVYETTPEVVYVGYTPGYVGAYPYGPTVVYGTGYYYPPWNGAYYYPAPVTFGFGFHYNPYTGWGMSVGVNFGMFSVSFGGYPGGFYGPHYHCPPHYHGGYGGYGGSYRGGGNTVNIDNSNNFYRNQGGAETRPNRPSQQPSDGRGQGNRGQGDRGPGGDRGQGNRPGSDRPSSGTLPSNQPGGDKGQGNRPGSDRPSAGTQPAGDRGGATGNRPSAQPANNTPNNVMSDKQGNVYRQNDKGGYDQRSNGSWNSASQNSQRQMQQQSQSRQRSNSMQNNYQRSGGGGGSRGGGGRGGGRR